MDDRAVDRTCLAVDGRTYGRDGLYRAIVAQEVSGPKPRTDEFSRKWWNTLSEFVGDLRVRYGEITMHKGGERLSFSAMGTRCEWEPRLVTLVMYDELERACRSYSSGDIGDAGFSKALREIWAKATALGQLARGVSLDPSSGGMDPSGSARLVGETLVIKTPAGTIVAEPSHNRDGRVVGLEVSRMRPDGCRIGVATIDGSGLEGCLVLRRPSETGEVREGDQRCVSHGV